MKIAKQQEKGFTIIEVMIVLVIAAVIILIVFLAVPALQRNSRNNQRKNDAARILAATNEWRANNSNKLPGQSPTGDRNSNGTADQTEILNNSGDLAYFTEVYIVPKYGTNNDLTGNTWADPTKVNLVTGAKCDSASSKAAGNGVIAVYATETGSGTAWQCI